MVAADNPKVSVVIPFYNIVDCAQYCMDSVLAQTYKNIEVVCVDDGSPDNILQVLEGYKADPRVRVYSKPNGGLSDARNFGVTKATGDYVTFVDGDDVLSPAYVQLLVDAAKMGTDVLPIGKAKYVSLESARLGSIEWSPTSTMTKISRMDLLKRMMYEQVLPSAWARLMPRERYGEDWFPRGHVYEEIATAGKLVESASEYIVIDQPIYGYVMRDNSIVHSKRTRFQQIDDYLLAIEKFQKVALRYVPADDDAHLYFRDLNLSRIYRLLGTVVDISDEVPPLKAQIRAQIQEDLPKLIHCSNISKGNKLRFAILAKTPALYSQIFNIYERFHNVD